MATLKATTISTHPVQAARPALSAIWIRRAVLAGLPLGAFGIANLVAEAAGIMPLFFAPFDLPGWAGAAVFLTLLPMLGLAYALVTEHGIPGQRAGWWVAALIGALIVFPFVIAPIDSLTLAVLVVALAILSLAASIRVAPLSRAAAWLMVPPIAWLVVCGALGLALAAAWSPPFALVNGETAPPAAG